MQHKTLEAKAVATDRGEFTALAATYDTDRVGDRIVFGAFTKTIAAWQDSGKRIPVHWDHEGSAANIIGSIDPTQVKEIEDEGLYVAGQLDLEDSEVAQEAWRSMKDNRVALSFGYMTVEERKAKDGVNELLEIDLFEVSIVSGPANPATRLLSLKSADDQRWLRKRTQELALEIAQSCEPVRATADSSTDSTKAVQGAIDAVAQPAEVHVDDSMIRAIVSDELAKQVSEVEDEVVEPTPQDPLRKRTYETALGVSNGGMKVRKRTEPESEPEPEPLDEVELRRRSFEARLSIASGK